MISSHRSSKRSASVSRAQIVNAVALLVAIPALAYSVALQVPSRIIGGATELVASASASLTASVPDNPYNTLAKELADEKAGLDVRAFELKAQQAAAAIDNPLQRYMTYGSFGMSLILLVLVALNFYLDMRRRSGRPSGYLEKKFLVDLR